MKYLLIIGLAFISGCVNLSKENHMMISEKDANYSESFCGYASAEWAQFGSENAASFKHQEIEVSFCAKAYYSKNIAAGFIIPFVPISGREYHAKRWIQISNDSKENELHIKTSLQFCKSRYPDPRCSQDSNNGSIVLKQGESGWVMLPDHDEFQLKMKSQETEYTFTLTKKLAYSWWMITV